MYIHKKIGIPVVFDHAHYDYKQTKGITMKEAMRLAMQTWKNFKIIITNCLIENP